MRYDPQLAARLTCSDTERAALAPLVEQIVSFAEKARREGLLSVEGDIPDIEDRHLKLGMKLVVDGTDPAVIEEVFHSALLSDNPEGATLRRRLIVLDGVLGFVAGEDPRLLRLRLAAHIGGEAFFAAGR